VDEEDTGEFGHLKAVLSIVSAKYKVCQRFVAQILRSHTVPQETTAIRNKVEWLLPRIVALEDHFSSKVHFESFLDNVDEVYRQSEVIQYAIRLPVVLGAEFFPVNSRTSKENSKNLNHNNLLTPFKTVVMFLGSSKIFGRQSSITGFVDDLSIVVGVNMASRWHNN
jgi:hypothetical protein